MAHIYVAIYNFLKPETNRGNFRLYFELIEKKNIEGATTSKTNTKTMISLLWTRLQGPQGFQKIRHHPLNKLMEVWCVKIAESLKNCQKTGIFDNFFSILTVFMKFP